MSYRDAGHREHARFNGKHPQTRIDSGPENLVVTLDAWGPQENLFTTMYDELQSNWGDRPMRTINRSCDCGRNEFKDRETILNCVTGWCQLSDTERAYVEGAFAGKTLPQVLEAISFMFTIDGVSRATTHQLVRTRIGAAMMQHGGRDNDWRMQAWRMPETIRRACAASEDDETPDGLRDCIHDPFQFRRELANKFGQITLIDAIFNYLLHGKDLYATLVDAGIPWQDARHLLTFGTETYIHINYTYAALRGVLANRLEHVMGWEINCIAQLMLREIKMRCPEVMSKFLGSHSDLAKQAKFAGLESWPPDGKWPVPEDVKYLSRSHRPEQNPFWVLSEAAMNGGPVEWIPTNGVYPR